MKMNLECHIIVILICIQSSLSISTIYLSTKCNQTASVTTGISLQSSTALTYPNSMSCYLEVSVPTNYKVVAVFRRFEFEPQNSGGACVDYVNFYDGTYTSGSLINTNRYCGSTTPTNITSTGTTLTVEMITDNSAIYRGFDLLLSAFSDAPCSSGQFACSNSLCISSSLECENYNQCGDDSDEASCTAEQLAGITGSDNSALIVGLSIGLGSLVIIGVLIGVYIYRQYKWKLFLKDPLPVIQQWDNENTYPLTKKYYKSFDDGYRTMRNGEGPSDVASFKDRLSTPNSGVSSKGILKMPQPTHSTA